MDVTAAIGSGNLTFTGYSVTSTISATAQVVFDAVSLWYGNFYGVAVPTLHFRGYEVSAELRTDLEARLNTIIDYPWYGNFYGTPSPSLHFRGYEVLSELHIVANVIPGVVTITGYQPTVTVPAIIEAKLSFELAFPWYGNFYGTPKTTIPFVGYTPTVELGIVAATGKQSLTLSSYAVNTTLSHNVNLGPRALTINGFAPIVTIGIPALANILTGVITLTGRAPTTSAHSNAAVGAGTLAFTGRAPTVDYTVVAAPLSSALSLTPHNALVAAGALSGLSTTRQLNITGLPVSTSASVNALPLVHEIFIVGRAPAYIFGTTAAISGKQSLTITPYNILTNSSDQIVVQTGTLNITGHLVTSSGSVSAATASYNPLFIQNYSVTSKSDAVSITGISALQLTSYRFDTVSSDGIDALITPGNLVIAGFHQSAGMSPPAAVTGTSQLKITGYNVLPTVYTFLSTSEIEIVGKQPAVSTTVLANVAARTVTISGKQVVVNVNEFASTSSTNISINGLSPTTNVIYDALFDTVQNIAIAPRQQSAQVSYSRSTLTSHITLTENTPTTAINYIQNLAVTQQMLIDGQNIIADDNAQLAQLGLGSLNIDGYYTRSGVYKRRRRAFIN